MRSFHAWVWFLGIAAVACTPDWARPVKDAGADAGDPEGDENDGGTESDDAAEPLLDADGSGGSNDSAAAEAGDRPGDGSTDAAVTADGGPDGGCGDGYVMQDGACRDIDECFDGTHGCHMTATCENTEGSYDCKCPIGYSGGTNAGFACASRIAVGSESATAWSSCVLLTDGGVQCWGENSAGQLGDGSQTRRTIPVGVSGVTNAVMISTAGRSACAVLRDGTARCWGENNRGQVGDGTTMNRATSVPVSQLSGVVSLTVGGGHSCAVLDMGAVKCWGDNAKGQLGNGTASNAVVAMPVLVSGIDDALSVFAYNSQTCVVRRSRAAQCWGEGFLGDASIASSLTPVNVKVPPSVTGINVGFYHACSVHADRHLNCWGPPALGGNGTSGGDGNPRPVLGTSAIAVGIGIYSTTILRADGTMAWWDAGTTPVAVDGLTNVVAMASFGTRVCEIHMDGAVSCWTILNAKLTPPETVQGIDLW
jgi:hypothetical protein